MIKIAARGLFVLLLAIALFAGLKARPVPQVVSHFDLILHFGAFAALSGLWVIGFARPLVGIAVLVAIGLGIEVWQGWMLPGRTADGWDMLANTLGVFCGWLSMMLLSRFVLSRVDKKMGFVEISIKNSK
ncbi:VanZ family protein [Microbulbifer flavimaris]|uniref:VanZ family protein n=1 Tax=Microbulbifer flavimaris TaxID=1781068 RepID=A0ABX4HY65_9GAMM|nr:MULTISPECIES: hypothetical protein [Microbulbifer]KUJ82432.1 hypothetical protein AVO43_11490 [Microbulbifer sp. ZGT114]PCO04637.1 VanZ family protein [Microbulbifer flavimaris]